MNQGKAEGVGMDLVPLVAGPASAERPTERRKRGLGWEWRWAELVEVGKQAGPRKEGAEAD